MKAKSLILIARQINKGKPQVENVYPRAVSWEGNERARKMVEEIFEPADMDWRKAEMQWLLLWGLYRRGNLPAGFLHF